MHLYDVPLIFILTGLVFYIVLGGADFGAGIWQLTAGSGEDAERLRDLAHEAMAPVWEANHVWLIFVLTVLWTAFPAAFASLASTLSIPLFAAAIGLILRGATYALRSGARTASETRAIDTLFALSSLLTPFALGAMVGAIVSGRVPVGNAAGRLVHSWTGPTSILIGALAIATSAYLAAVFLCADARRAGAADLEVRFRRRALLSGVAAGGLAAGGLVVLHADAHRVFHRLLEGPGLPALIVSVACGAAALGLVWRSRFGPARALAALAVAAIIAGWALAQQPVLLRGLTLPQAAAPHDALVLVIVAVLGGGAILFPSLGLLFRLVLGGRLGHGVEAGPGPDAPPGAQAAPGAEESAGGAAPRGPRAGAVTRAAASGLRARAAGACLLAGVGLLTVAEAGWAHAVGVVCLLAFVVVGVGAVDPTGLAADQSPASRS